MLDSSFDEESGGSNACRCEREWEVSRNAFSAIPDYRVVVTRWVVLFACCGHEHHRQVLPRAGALLWVDALGTGTAAMPRPSPRNLRCGGGIESVMQRCEVRGE
jgi:hypothetical protein